MRLLNSRRGWDPQHTPTADVAWALDEVAARFGADLPVCLIGHSLGGRAALLSANRSQVRGVVALAPWVYSGDDAPGLKGTPIVIVHGDHDRIASPERSRQVAGRLRARTAVTFIAVRRGSHSMLGRAGTFDGLAARCTAWILLDEHDDPLIAQIAAGATSLEV